MRGNQLHGHLDLLVLGALRQSPAHGYGVITRLRESSAGAFDLAEGTVYPALHRLEADGLLSASYDLVQGRRRTVYTLSPSGREELTRQRTQWHLFSLAVTQVIGATA